MGIEAGGKGSLGSNPSGVGAVYLGQMPDLLDIQQKGNQEIDNFLVRKQQEKLQNQKLAHSILADLSVKDANVRPVDLQPIQQDVNSLYKNYQDLSVKYNGNIPPDALGELQRQRENIELKVRTSASLMDFGKQQAGHLAAKPEDYDGESGKRVTQYFGASMNDATKMMGGLLQPRKTGLLELTKTKVLKDAPLDETDVTVKDPVSGGYVTQKIKTYTQQRINGLAQAGYADPRINEEANFEYNKTDATRQAAYEQQAVIASKAAGRVISPQELFYRDYLSGINPRQKEQSGVSYTPQQHAYWQHFYKDDNEEDFVKYVAEAVKKADSNDTDFWGEETPTPPTTPVVANESTLGIQVGGAANPVPRISNAFNGLPLGNATVPKYAVETDPQTKKKSPTDVIESYQSVPNRVLGMMKVNGKTYIQTDESLILGSQGQGDGWKELNDRTIDQLVLGTKNPIKAAGVLRKTLVQMGAYPDQNVKLTPNNKVGGKEEIGGYRVGQSEGGYIYQGGDPTKQENWKKE